MRQLFCIWCLLVLPLFAGAATGSFSVRTPIGEDTTPPTVPTILTATPIAATQIDIEWSPSTDDFQLTGYTVSRDGFHIATTTLTTFSDTGLAASTTYSYTVRAFDWLGNISSSSSPVATTTLSLPPPAGTSTATTTRNQGASGKIYLQGGVNISTDYSSATFVWGTNRPSRFVLRWGRTSSYELGFVTTERYRDQHQTTISDLMPGTQYYYELIAYNPANTIPQVLSQGQFTTALPADAVLPPNVSRLVAVVQGEDVQLTWQNPAHPTGYYVRVLRNHLGYPSDLHDGMVVYQGTGERFFDTGALSAHAGQYYTVFVVDENGNVSSGAVARAIRPSEAGSGGFPVRDGGESGSSTTVPLPPLPPEVVLPSLDREQIRIVQNGLVFTFADPIIMLSSELPLTLQIPTTALPPHLKSIIVSLLDPTNHRQSYTFLLRRNSSGTNYEAVLAPLAVSGVSQLLVEVYDYEAKVVGRYGKQIEFTAFNPNDTTPVVFPDMLLLPLRRYFMLVMVVGGMAMLALLLWFWFLWRRKRKTEQHTA